MTVLPQIAVLPQNTVLPQITVEPHTASLFALPAPCEYVSVDRYAASCCG